MQLCDIGLRPQLRLLLCCTQFAHKVCTAQNFVSGFAHKLTEGQMNAHHVEGFRGILQHLSDLENALLAGGIR